jgi:hypothetical protein
MIRTLRSCPLLCVLLGAACTPLDPPTVREPAELPDATPPADDGPTRPDATPRVAAAVASVGLEQDCPDPPRAQGVSPTQLGAIEPAKPTRGDSLDASEQEGERRSASRRACNQAAVQMSLEHTGGDTARIHIASIGLRDLQADAIVATVASRGPTVWGPDATYVEWDERIAAGAKLQVGYRLTPPNWGDVEAKLGGASSQARDFALEVTLEVDGKPMTVRSPAFRRAAPERIDMVET